MDPRQQQPWQQPQQQPPSPPTQQPPAGYAGGVQQQQIPAGFQPAQDPGNPQQSPAQAPQSTMQPVQPDSFSPDYLDQITGPAPVKNTKGTYLFWIIIGLAVITAGVLAFVMLANRPTSTDKAAELYLRMETLKKVSEETHRHLRDNNLRVNNRSYSLFLTNAIRDIEKPLAAAGVKKGQIPKPIRDEETSLASRLKTEFDDARLNIALDRVYTREMTHQLNTLQAMMKGIYDMNSNKEMREYLETTNDNLAPVARSFSEFAATK